jgi:phosphonopyruvate decarboxylase
MISVERYFTVFKRNNIDYFVGIPDSSLKSFVSFAIDNIDEDNHIIAANEGACIAISAGYHIATNKIPLVYFQNSGLGNTVNPLLSLADKEVYKIPMLLFIGWRGEPHKKDEPQHIKQGQVTLSMLDSMGISYEVIDDNEDDAISKTSEVISSIKNTGIPHAIVARKGIFTPYRSKYSARNSFTMSREDALKIVVGMLNESDIIVSTTGKLSRELFEYRESAGQSHKNDFLTVGSMGYASSIAYGIAREKQNRNIYCFDGDGAALMHLGALSNIGNSQLENIKHIIFNNGAHESVGGQETLGYKVDFCSLALACGYRHSHTVDNAIDLVSAVNDLKSTNCVSMLEIKVGLNSRKNLGRPTITPIDNKIALMSNLMKDS